MLNPAVKQTIGNFHQCLLQFWTLYILCGAQNKDAVRLTLEQIDVVRRMCENYNELELVTSSQGDQNIFEKKYSLCF